MFLHINTFGQQISLHSKDAVAATEGKAAVEEKRDAQDNVIQPAEPAIPATPAKPAEPLRSVVKEAMDHWKKTETDLVALGNGNRLDLNKTAAENGLKENDFVSVVSQKSLDESVATKQAELDAVKKLAGK